MEMNFTGKWAFEVASVGYVGLAGASEQLSIISSSPVNPPPKNVLFNAYGRQDAFVLQSAGNGKYVIPNSDGYAASSTRDGSLANFSLEVVGAGVRVVEHSAGQDHYWNRQADGLKRIAKTASPPETTLFTQIVRTPGLAEIQKGVPGADLSWAYLVGANLAQAWLPDVDLSDANLSQAAMKGINLQGPKTSLARADLSGADLSSANMPTADLTGAKLIDAKLCRATLSDAKFNDANLTRADLTSAIMTGVSLQGAQLSQATLNKAWLFKAVIDANTDFTAANMQGADLSHNNLGRCHMSKADLTGADLSNTLLYGVNLSDATLTGADLTGAQVGALALLFSVTDPQKVTEFKDALNRPDSNAVANIFKQNGVTLQPPVTITPSTSAPDRVWKVEDSPKNAYAVRLEAANVLKVYQKTSPANLAGVFMPGVILTEANLYAVSAAYAQLYGQAKLDRTILENADLANANLGSTDLSRALLSGARLDGAILTNTNMTGADLSPSDTGQQASLVRANLQGAVLTDAKLDQAIFTDAAVAVANAASSSKSDGVWLFDMDGPDIAPCIGELDAAAKRFTLAAKYAADLTPGKVDNTLRTAFKTKGVTLSEDASVAKRPENDTYWQITDGQNTYTITKGITSEGEPALIVRYATTSFALPLLAYRPDLRDGTVNEHLRQGFVTYGHVTLTEQATLQTKERAIAWEIIDTSPQYTLWLGFVDGSTEEQISVMSSIPNIRRLFEQAGFSLRWQATVNKAKENWQLDNDSNNPFQTLLGYIQFNLLQSEQTGPLGVYGATLRIVRLSQDHPDQLEYYNIICQATNLQEAALPDTMCCPNESLVSLNKRNKLPFRRWMRAASPPKPPTCVPSPDGYYYCPSVGPGQRGQSEEEI